MPTRACCSTCGRSASCRRIRLAATNWWSWCGSTRSRRILFLDERLQHLGHECEEFLVADYGRISAGDRPLGVDGAPAAATADAGDRARRIIAGVERNLHEVVGAAIRHQSNAAGRREDGERVAFDFQDVCDLLEQR